MQYHLKGAGFSGRAVRCRELLPQEVSDNMTAAAKLVGIEGSMFELKKVEWLNGVKRMVVEFSDPCENPLAESVKWKKVVPGMLDDLGAYFKAKDILALEAIYRNSHEVTSAELDAITGGALPVSVD